MQSIDSLNKLFLHHLMGQPVLVLVRIKIMQTIIFKHPN